MEETRNLKITFTTGGSGSTTCKMGLPTTWIREMGITPEDRDIEVTFDKEKQTITIKRKV